MKKKMKHTEISDLFSKFTEAFYNVDAENFDLEKKTISEEIHQHIFKIKSAQWKQGIEFRRRKKMPLSDIFQDIIALYLKLALGIDFEVILEEKIDRLQPDILIRHNGKNLFILEIKTTIGWERNSINGKFQERMKVLSEKFNIPEENIVYIFQSPWNVNAEFANRYWDKSKNKPKELPTEFPFNKIRPLMTSDDPYYWKHEKGFDRNQKYIDYSDKFIKKLSKESIVIPLELTIKEIKKTANM
jgi:hypothetical protein